MDNERQIQRAWLIDFLRRYTQQPTGLQNHVGTLISIHSFRTGPTKRLLPRRFNIPIKCFGVDLLAKNESIPCIDNAFSKTQKWGLLRYPTDCRRTLPSGQGFPIDNLGKGIMKASAPGSHSRWSGVANHLDLQPTPVIMHSSLGREV